MVYYYNTSFLKIILIKNFVIKLFEITTFIKKGKKNIINDQILYENLNNLSIMYTTIYKDLQKYINSNKLKIIFLYLLKIGPK